VIIGVHTPEFSFEHNLDNVKQAVKQLNITYPVAADNEYVIWSAFDNHYWPALYFVDATGHIRHRQSGEGEYAMSEHVIQELLTAAGAPDVASDVAVAATTEAEVAADWDEFHMPETYLGYQRGFHFASPEGAKLGKRWAYTVPADLRLNLWALQGAWTIAEEAIVSDGPGSKIAFRFHARDVNLVMGPVMRAADSIPFHTRLNGRPPGTAHGNDTNSAGDGIVKDQHLYQLLRQPNGIQDSTFEITFSGSDVSTYVFTFG